MTLACGASGGLLQVVQRHQYQGGRTSDVPDGVQLEVAAGTAMVKELATGEQDSVPFGDLAAHLLSRI